MKCIICERLLSSKEQHKAEMKSLCLGSAGINAQLCPRHLSGALEWAARQAYPVEKSPTNEDVLAALAGQ